MAAPKYLLIDGHSVIFQWPELRRLHDKQPRQARAKLIAALEDLHDTSDWLVTLVYDGKQGQKVKNTPGRMVVLYGQTNSSADSIIERLVSKAKNPSHCHVVTADMGERETILALGAFPMTPDDLRYEMEQVSADFDRIMKDVHRKANW